MKKLVGSVLLFITSCVYAGDSTMVIVKGFAFDAANTEKRLDDLMIINLRTNQGVFGKADGSFNLQILKSDTFMIASTGYEFKKFSVKDSLENSEYNFQIPLTKLNVKLKEVQIFSTRDLQNIYKDIEKLGYRKEDFQLEGIDALQSPITFLYQEFSRFQRLRRHNAERINNERRRDLLKQLLSNYVTHDIINLEDMEFDDFIDFAQVPEEYMKAASQYDFCIYIKRKFEAYKYAKKH